MREPRWAENHVTGDATARGGRRGRECGSWDCRGLSETD